MFLRRRAERLGAHAWDKLDTSPSSRWLTWIALTTHDSDTGVSRIFDTTIFAALGALGTKASAGVLDRQAKLRVVKCTTPDFPDSCSLKCRRCLAVISFKERTASPRKSLSE
eukprot:scaffold2963_cov250-Pinguiococcus_pyrenoidosus.AAC.30